MRSLKKRLPPLNALIAFEAAARHLSFTVAAAELSLSQAAVSQGVKQLEDSLDVQLFERTHRSIKLTERGRPYYQAVQSSLQQIAEATTELTAAVSGRRLTVAADQSIAGMLLIPRLPDFQQQHPGIPVRVIASDLEADCLADDTDVAIIHGDGNWIGFQSTLLFAEQIIVVCSPAFLDRNPRCTSLAHLTSCPLLNLESAHWNWMEWRTWLSRNDIHLPVKYDGLQINNYPMLIEAARNGQGLALGWRHLVDHYLEDGSLVQPVKSSVSTEYGYYLVTAESNQKSQGLSAFSSWVKTWTDKA